MPLIFDKLTAAVVGAVVFLLLFGLQAGMHGERLEDALADSKKNQILKFAEMLERDLGNAGYGSVPGDEVVLQLSSTPYDSVSVTAEFQFWGLGESGSRSRIRYSTVRVDSALVLDAWVPVFRVARYEDDGSGWQPTGDSSPMITAFSIRLLDESNKIANPASARQIRIRIASAVAVDSTPARTDHGSILAGRELRWGITLAPPGLSLQNFRG